jgi:hypothetical protein
MPLKERGRGDTGRIVAPFLADLGYRDALPADAPADARLTAGVLAGDPRG